MKLKIKKMLITNMIFFLTTLSSSCSAFFGEDGYLITSSSTSINDKGETVLTINFSDSEKTPLTIIIPKGLSGKDGVGIASITPNLENDKVKITIKYTDDTLPDSVIEVPVIHGNDGKGIKEVKVGKDNVGNTTINFVYTDETESGVITIPKGGDGNGIVDIHPIKKDEDKKITTYEITFTNGTSSTFEVADGRDGKDGISVLNLNYNEILSDNMTYVIDVEFSDGFVSNISLPRPVCNTWLNGTYEPNNSDGNNGDFYLNIVNGNVYLKENGGRNFRFSIKGNESTKIETGIVVFNYFDILNAPKADYISGVLGKTIDIEKIPVLVDSGKTFLGWFTTRQEDYYSVNAGKFTDLTTLSDDLLNLYAWRE